MTEPTDTAYVKNMYFGEVGGLVQDLCDEIDKLRQKLNCCECDDPIHGEHPESYL